MLYTIDSVSRQNQTVSTFGGLNTTCNAAPNEFADMLNISSERYPALSESVPYSDICSGIGTVLGALYRGNDIYLVRKKDGSVQFGKISVTGVASNFESVPAVSGLSDSKKTLVSMGGYIIIFPDKIQYNTVDDTAENMEKTFACGPVKNTSSASSYSEPVLCYICDRTGEKFPGAYADSLSGDAESVVILGASGNVEFYRKADGVTTKVEDIYLKIFRKQGSNWDGIEEGDGIVFRYWEQTDNIYSTVVSKGKEKPGNGEDYELEYIIIGDIENYTNTAAVRNDNLRAVFNQEGWMYFLNLAAFTVNKLTPDMDYVVECNNRLWGCSSQKNEIYASALGLPANWYTFDGISTDSYVLQVGTYGDFTGACVYGGYPLFFKEEYMIKMYGYYPAAYQMKRIDCPGIKKGDSGTIATCGGVLYYKSSDDIYGYDGTWPVKVSYALDGITFGAGCVAAATYDKYYIKNAFGIYSYDPKTNTWCKDSSYNGGACFLSSQKYVYICGDRISKSRSGNISNQTWYAVTGEFGRQATLPLYPVRLAFVFSCAREFAVDISYDSEYSSTSRWDRLFEHSGAEKGKQYVYCPIRRCDTFRLRFSGKGAFRLYALNIITEDGGDIQHGKL